MTTDNTIAQEWDLSRFEEFTVEVDAGKRALSEELAGRDAERLAAARRQEFIDAGAPPRALDLVLAGELEDTPALRAVKGAYRRGLDLVGLSGPPGVGKSVALVWAMMQPFAAPIGFRTESPMFVTASRLARWRRFSDTAMERLERASVLLVDEVGVQFDDRAGAFRSLFDSLVGARHGARLATVLATNVPPPAFLELVGGRMADRLHEDGALIAVPGESLRRQRGALRLHGGGGPARPLEPAVEALEAETKT